MPGKTSIDVSQSVRAYEAFKTLTTNRAQNRGTIEVVNDRNGIPSMLKCAID